EQQSDPRHGTDHLSAAPGSADQDQPPRGDVTTANDEPQNVEAAGQAAEDSGERGPFELVKLADHRGKEYDILEASERGKLELVKRLVQTDASLVNVADPDGYTPLHRAAYNNRIEVVKWLVD